MAWNGLIYAVLPFRNYSLTHAHWTETDSRPLVNLESQPFQSISQSINFHLYQAKPVEKKIAIKPGKEKKTNEKKERLTVGLSKLVEHLIVICSIM